MDFQPHFWHLPTKSVSCGNFGAPDATHKAYSQMSLLFDYCPNGVIDNSTKISFQPANFTACSLLPDTSYSQDATTGHYTVEPKLPEMDPRYSLKIVTANNGTTTLTAPQTNYVTQSYTVAYAQFKRAIDNLNSYVSPSPNLVDDPASWCWESAHINSETLFNQNETTPANVQFGWSATNINIKNTQ